MSSVLPHYIAVLWTEISGSPQKMATLILSDNRMVLNYDDDYFNSGLP